MRVTLVGAGRWGNNIARALKDLESKGLVELGQVIDLDLGRALELSRTYGFSGMGSRVEDAAGDAIIIATSIDSLYSTAIRAVELFPCIFVEKPVAQSSREAAELLARAESRGVVHQAGYISRFDPTVAELRKRLGGLKPYALRFRRLSRRPPHMLRHPVTLDLTTHDVDLASYLLKPRSVEVLYSVLAVGWGAPQRVVANLSYDGVDVLIETDGLLPVKVREVDVLGEEGFARADLVSGIILLRGGSGTTRIEIGNEEPLKKELETFLRRCRGEDLEAPDLRDAVATLRTIEELSSRAGRIPCGVR